MTNYKMIFSYDGTRYAGWQKQGNTDNTIQGKLEELLSRLTGESVEVAGAGRTDAGVHAAGQVANFKLHTPWPAAKLQEKINEYLPGDIAVLSLEEAPERFHSRLNAKGKCYEYRIWNSTVPNVFERKFMTQIPEKLDVAKMNAAAAQFVGTHDFKALCSLKRYKKSTVRTIYSLKVEQDGAGVRIVAEGDGFLYNMVRIIAGTLIEVGLGQRSVESIKPMIESKDRQMSGYTAQPQGLFLVKVWY